MPHTTVELFAGMGGLALGASQAEFEHRAVVEINQQACETIRLNVNSGRYYTAKWPLHQTDVRKFSYDGLHADVLAGGVPCQPFSRAGAARGDIDQRNMFPEFFRAQLAVEPKIALIENVPALASATFPQYLRYISLQMEMPSVLRRPGETWTAHLGRLVSAHEGGRHVGTTYRVHAALLNAADYGVPQWRERLFIVGVRQDLGEVWAPPEATHSRVSLVRDQWVTGDYWGEHGRRRPSKSIMGPRLMGLVRRRDHLEKTDLPRWRTVRDALKVLPALKPGQTDPEDASHFLNPGARAYGGHSGSRADEPAKTIKAGAHGVPGGENTLILPNGRLRYFSVREAALLQGFPRDYHVDGAWIAGMRQVGNAVPPPLARAVFESLNPILTKG